MILAVLSVCTDGLLMPGLVAQLFVERPAYSSEVKSDQEML